MIDFDLPLTVITATVLPILLGALIGFPFWRRRRVIMGNILASTAVAIVILFLIAQAFGLFFGCSAAQDPSCSTPEAMTFSTRVLIGLAVIGWLDVFVLLFLSGLVEDQARKRSFRLEDL
jgi:ABC-type branched-subunit amino acid transport system permease subunit